MPSPLHDRDATAHATEPARRGRWSGRRRLLAAGIAAAVAIPVGGLVVDRFAGWDPLAQDVVDRSTPPLLLALDDLEEYHAASGTFQVVIDQERDTRYVPAVISGERVSFLATGTVDAYVDFGGLGPGRVQLSPDGGSATITLPAPQLGEARIDPEQSRVLDRDRGLVERVGDVFEDNPTDDGPLYSLAEDRLETAAAHSDLRARAEKNTRQMLTTLARSLGVDSVTVTFEPAPGAQA